MLTRVLIKLLNLNRILLRYNYELQMFIETMSSLNQQSKIMIKSLIKILNLLKHTQKRHYFQKCNKTIKKSSITAIEHLVIKIIVLKPWFLEEKQECNFNFTMMQLEILLESLNYKDQIIKPTLNWDSSTTFKVILRKHLNTFKRQLNSLLRLRSITQKEHWL